MLAFFDHQVDNLDGSVTLVPCTLDDGLAKIVDAVATHPANARIVYFVRGGHKEGLVQIK